MDEKRFAAAVAEQAGLAKEEAADLVRGTLEELGKQLSGGEVRGLAAELPAGLGRHLPAHEGGAHPVPLTDFVRHLSERTGLKEEEARRGAAAVLSTLGQVTDSAHLQHALSQLPAEYRQLTVASA
jgi:uncharacterized protein (DUF2267 family)